MLIQVTLAREAMSGLPVICEISRKRKSTAMPARLDSTRIVATTRPQPAIQPTHGPKARAAQVNEVPESGIRLLSSRYPKATRSIGMKPTRMIAGICDPTVEATGPTAAVKV